MSRTRLRRPLPTGLVDHWFHTLADEPCVRCRRPHILHQGHVCAAVPPDYYLVQYFEWLLGEPIYRALIPTIELANPKWRFYPTREIQMGEWEHVAPHQTTCDEERLREERQNEKAAD